MKRVISLILALIFLLSAAAAPGCTTSTSKDTGSSNNLTTNTPVITEQQKQDIMGKAIAYQTEGGVYKADTYQVCKLKKGDVIYGTLPGQSAFYTDQTTVEKANGSYISLYKLLQIRPHPVYGYRTKVGKYEVLQDMYLACGSALANREITVDGKTENLGDGGGYQYVILDFANSLKLLEETTLYE
jgi:hypothetical protein